LDGTPENKEENVNFVGGGWVTIAQ
jgi:hypothetical protein